MKLYLLTNMYCGGNHPGIQGVHSAVELVVKYTSDDRDFPELSEQVLDWATEHKTVIMLKSGMAHDGLAELTETLDKLQSDVSINRMKDQLYQQKYPIVPFAEFKEPGLNNTITSIAVLCTTKMVEDMEQLRRGLLGDDEFMETYGEVLGNILLRMTFMSLV
jgi:hypothetical protein